MGHEVGGGGGRLLARKRGSVKWVTSVAGARAASYPADRHGQTQGQTDQQAGRQGHDSRSHSQRAKLKLGCSPEGFIRHACHIPQALEHQHKIPYGPDSQCHASDDELCVV